MAIIRVIVAKQSWTDAVMRFDVEGQVMPGLEHHAGRPELDIYWDDLSWNHRLDFIMKVIWPILARSLQVELAMRDAQPAFRDRYWLVVRADAGHLIPAPIEVADGHKEIHLRAGRSDPQS